MDGFCRDYKISFCATFKYATQIDEIATYSLECRSDSEPAAVIQDYPAIGIWVSVCTVAAV